MSLLLPPCTAACPVYTDVRGYLAAIARGDYREAERLIRATNPFAAVCAWVCPHPCEERCRRGQVEEPLAVRALKRFALEKAGGRNGFSRPSPSGHSGVSHKVAVVGAGPAGLTAAYDLATRGYLVTVFERWPEAGGHLYASLPTYRLPRHVVRQDVARIKAAGVEIRTGVEIGKDLGLSELKEKFDAVILAVGLSSSRCLNLPGFEHPQGVLPALPFLQGANLGRPHAVARRVIVIGGGDVAMDVARVALRLGAREVRVVCLEFREIMPAHSWEIQEALEEGVELWPGWGPVRVLLEGDRIQGLAVKGVVSVFDEKGRFNPRFDESRTAVVPGEMIIQAIGQCADLTCLDGSAVAVNERGQLLVDGDRMTTSEPGIFACGEVATGPGPAVNAVASGHRAAAAVCAYLEGERISATRPPVIPDLPQWIRPQLPSLPRQEVPVLPVEERRSSFVPVESGFTQTRALREAERCLRCGLGAVVNTERCVACLTCRRVCPYGVPVVEGRASIGADACQGCGICATACPAGAIEITGLPAEKVNALLAGVAAAGDAPGNVPGRVSGGPDAGNVADCHGPAASGMESPAGAADPPLAVFVCQRAHFLGLPPGFTSLASGMGRAKVITLPTAGALDPVWLLRALEGGARGVAVITCGDEQCRHAGGAARVKGQLKRFRNLLSDLGYDPVCLQWHTLGVDGDPLAWLSAFARRVAQVDKA
ncbi:FAD-dependent oxidoreductase [Desulfofundulus thermobenzoicus]|uniref:dihydrouracil dehydrogenase (NAD(+)) n=1 Tax=Desulfofundulus thermobenzoicus TaxID=29376 RepID=A0A6N7ITQ1_9FIRM|nr:FAD-dependent oxidoreductase [Desulfofundulus thermobenzoicus]MQL52478.1 FAD-dependent oxidoreductase [Desulfofundulus thermobenzoicus]HHW44591.1 FAD-dependent oxidoreductase [Desulfotomaculum sp.]